MASAKAVVLTFRTEGKAIKAVRLANFAESLLSARQQLVHVALMTHVPHKFVVRCAENLVHRDGQLHHAEIRAQMAAGAG